MIFQDKLKNGLTTPNSQSRIEIEEYDNQWPVLFKQEKAIILNKASKYIEQIEHIGSTAISGISAKPTIDMCIGVKSLEIADKYLIEPLIELGYDYLKCREKGIPNRRYLQKLDINGKHLFHIHIAVINEQFWNEHIGFRDYLIKHPKDMQEYQKLKLELQRQYSNDREKYTINKANFIKSIIEKLEKVSMKIHYILHASFEGVGAIETWATERGHTLSGTHTYKGEKLPDDINSFDFLIVMGGPQSVVEIEEYPYLQDEVKYIKKVIDAEKLVLGICLGSQLISEALGAKAEHSPNREIGKFPVSLSADGKNDSVFSKFSDSFDVFHWHSDMPGLAKGATLLATSEGCPRQAFKYGNRVYGTQFHLELTPELVDGMIKHSSAEELAPGKYVQNPHELKLIDCKSINQKLFTLLDGMSNTI